MRFPVTRLDSVYFGQIGRQVVEVSFEDLEDVEGHFGKLASPVVEVRSFVVGVRTENWIPNL